MLQQKPTTWIILVDPRLQADSNMSTCITDQSFSQVYKPDSSSHPITIIRMTLLTHISHTRRIFM